MTAWPAHLPGSLAHSPATMSVKSKPFFTDFRCTWLGKVAKPTYCLSISWGKRWHRSKASKDSRGTRRVALRPVTCQIQAESQGWGLGAGVWELGEGPGRESWQGSCAR